MHIQGQTVQWVFIVTHSCHDEEYERIKRNKIGDISIAIDHTGSIFTNASHVCGDACFCATNGLPPLSSADFFSRFRGESGNEVWVRYKTENAQQTQAMLQAEARSSQRRVGTTDKTDKTDDSQDD